MIDIACSLLGLRCRKTMFCDNENLLLCFSMCATTHAYIKTHRERESYWLLYLFETYKVLIFLLFAVFQIFFFFFFCYI